MSKNRLAALTGAAFFVATVISFGATGDTPTTDDSIQTVVDFYKDQSDASVYISVTLGIIACALLVLYTTYLRRLFDTLAGPGHIMPSIVFAGGIILATGIAFDTTIVVAVNDAVDDVDPIAVQTLNTIYNNDYIPMALGMATIGLGSGLSILHYGGLPKWLGWVALLLALLLITPIGFAGFIGMGVWILVTSILLGVRNEEPAAA